MTDPINSTTRTGPGSVSNSTRTTKADGQTAASSAPAAQSSEAPPAEDRVSLTGESLRLQEIQQSLADIPEVDAEKVALLRKQIAQGQYPIDASRIADKLVELEQALGSTIKA